MGTASATLLLAQLKVQHTFTTHQLSSVRYATLLRPSNNGGHHASDTDHVDNGDDHDGAAAQLPGVRRGRRSCSGAAARRLIGVRVRRRLLRGAGRGARTHRALLFLRPGVRRAGPGARRVLRLHQAGALAEERAPGPPGCASRGDKAAGCATATAAAATGAVTRDGALSSSSSLILCLLCCS